MDVYKGAPPHDHISMGEEFIEHHGVMGMKWGVRRYQPYPKGYNGGVWKKYKREMKDLGDKGLVGKYSFEMRDLKKKGLAGKYKAEMRDIVKADKTFEDIRTARQTQRLLNKNDYKLSENRYDKWDLEKRKSEIQSKINKSKNVKANERRLRSIGKLNSKIAVKNSNIKAHEKTAKKILQEANKNGYTIRSKSTMRTVHKGEIAAQMLIATPALALGAPVAVITTKQTAGIKYKVRKPK